MEYHSSYIRCKNHSMTTLKIEVYFQQESNGNIPTLIPLSRASAYLTEKQLLPNVGDEMAIHMEDALRIGITDPLDIQRIQTVFMRRFNDATADVAIFVRYKAR